MNNQTHTRSAIVVAIDGVSTPRLTATELLDFRNEITRAQHGVPVEVLTGASHLDLLADLAFDRATQLVPEADDFQLGEVPATPDTPAMAIVAVLTEAQAQAPTFPHPRHLDEPELLMIEAPPEALPEPRNADIRTFTRKRWESYGSAGIEVEDILIDPPGFALPENAPPGERNIAVRVRITNPHPDLKGEPYTTAYYLWSEVLAGLGRDSSRDTGGKRHFCMHF